MSRGATALGAMLGATLVGLLVVPLVALAWSSSLEDVRAGLAHAAFAPALGLSVRTSLVSLALTVVLGTPLAWWLASSRSPWARVVALAVELPVVVPPAVLGVALLQTLGRRGVLGPMLATLGVSLPFTPEAVVLAQLIVASPLYVQAAVNAFAKVEPDMLLVARTLGASPAEAFARVALPIAAPGLVVGASLAWARALGEFGATLLFAGNMPGSTQTLPLATFSALESDVRVAVVFALVLAAVGLVLLAMLRVVPATARAWAERRSEA